MSLPKTDRDGAVTTYAYDSAGNLTNQVMPGNAPVWCASYNSALQKQFDYDAGSGSGVTRSNQLHLLLQRQACCNQAPTAAA